ncbi:hypothetical protein [Pseudomonas sp. PDM09]|uniref:hypothetical protein n=1 Tax=Pseudomonas sp. PDM09 TaxID=2769270 RepID=UPI00177C1D5E|nr:hypothetical protein [Pseudomonas sp. PDM09]MBD9563980.1 hypothetical protein [Pseudomonas sp. PDM09]
MARNIENRLSGLRSRRSGTDRLNKASAFDSAQIIANSLSLENYEKRTTGKPYTRYAIGSMQEVDEQYTKISIGEAERVGKQLNTGLTELGFSVNFRLQGSVPCNIHIRGISDVDLLVLDEAFFTYDRTGQTSRLGLYNSPISYTPLSALQLLRNQSELILVKQFPAVDVDTTGGKAITLTGGSLRRPVDVVPSHWHNTEDYQTTNKEVDRAIYILDKNIPTSVFNKPFKHIDKITNKDIMTLGGLKKSIRLCKHIKADAVKEGTNINLPSFDIAATLWHADASALISGFTNELAILVETKRHLTFLHNNRSHAQSLRTPDDTRLIFDSDSKFKGLELLLAEVNDLALEVAKEQNHSLLQGTYSWGTVDETLRNSKLPRF